MHVMSVRASSSLWIAAVLALGAAGARAAEWSMAPGFAVSVDHDTNRTLAAEPIASEGLSMSADMRAQYSTERFDLSVLPQVHLQRFSDRRFDRSHDGSLTADGLWRNERSQFDLNALLRDQSTLSSEIFSTGIIDLNTRRRDEQANASWSFAYAERRVFSLSAAYQTQTYHGNATTLQDNKYLSFDAAERFILSEQLSASVDASTGRYTTEIAAHGARSDTVEVGFVEQFSERVKLTGNVGINRRTDLLTTKDGFIGQIALSRGTDIGNFSVSVGRSVIPSGFGVFTQSDQGQLAYNRGLSPRLTFGANLSTYRSSSAFQSFTFGERTYSQAGMSLSWQADEYWNVGLSALASKANGTSAFPEGRGWQVALSSVWHPSRQSISR